jgi:hypothetical protein
MKKLYNVTRTYNVVIHCEEDDIHRLADEAVKGDIDNPTYQSSEELTKVWQLPLLWNADSRPWGNDEKSIGEILRLQTLTKQKNDSE